MNLKIVRSCLTVGALMGLTAHCFDTALAEEEPSQSLLKEAIIARIQPVGTVIIDGAAPPPIKAEQGLPEERVFKKYCSACHLSGVAGAPKFRHKDAWEPRLSQGKEVLLQHALHGYKSMPAKGNCSNCTEDEIWATIQYMTHFN